MIITVDDEVNGDYIDIQTVVDIADLDLEYWNIYFNIFDFENSIKYIYVDCNNTNGPWNGSEEYPYQYIQDAVDNPSFFNSTIIYIANGNYNENITINKKSSIYLCSMIDSEIIYENDQIIIIIHGYIATINGSITVNDSNNIIFQCFNIINTTISNSTSVIFNHCISNNNYKNHCVDIYNSHHIYIESFKINNSEYGILVGNSSYITIRYSNIYNNHFGMLIINSNNIEINKNQIYDNLMNGMFVVNSSVDIFENQIYKNGKENYFYLSGILLYKSNKCNIKYNNFYSNKESDIYLKESYENNVTHNNLEDDNCYFFQNKLFQNNYWRFNYWGEISHPKIIYGKLFFGTGIIRIPWINVDWCPSIYPFDDPQVF